MHFLSPSLNLLAAIVSYLIAADLLERTARWTCISSAGFALRASRHIWRVYGGRASLRRAGHPLVACENNTPAINIPE